MGYLIGFLASVVLIQGCGAVHLYDQRKDRTAQGAKTQYAETNLLGAMATARENIDALLAEERKLLHEARQLQLELALVRMADGELIADRLDEDSPLSVRMRELGHDTVKDLRDFVQNVAATEGLPRRIADRARRIERLARKPPPACGAQDFKAGLDSLTEGVTDQTTRRRIETHITVYSELCSRNSEPLRTARGEIAGVHDEWQKARERGEERRRRAADAEKALATATLEHEAAANAVKSAATPEARARLERAAKALRAALETTGPAGELLDVELVPETRVRAIDTILGAIATGRVEDAGTADASLARAAAVASGVRSLAGIDVMIRSNRAPAVSDLLIEKEHQLVLRDDAQSRANLGEQRVAMLEKKYRALIQETRWLLDEHDALCNFLDESVNPKPRDARPVAERINCDTLMVKSAGGERSCAFVVGAGQVALAGDKCPLFASWPTVLSTASVAPKRELYNAIAALARRTLIAQVQVDEAEVGLTRLLHREAEQSNEYALRAWNALIATPIGQLAAYHATGIKPAELADLIIKAVGLGAIGVGVNR